MEGAGKRILRFAYIHPGKPQQNVYIERYNRTMRGEWFASTSLTPSRRNSTHQAPGWLWTDNNQRPNKGLGGITPAMKRKAAA